LTSDRDFKRLVRDRVRKTGESYALARHRLLSKAGGTSVSPNPEELEHIVVLSQDQARTLGHNFIGTEHVLLALMVDECSVAAEVLAAFDVTLEQVRSKVQDLIGSTEASTADLLPQTPRARKVIEYARQEVVDLGQVYVGSQHLLLGLIKEGQGVAIVVLNHLGVDLQQLRTATLRAMGAAGN
jgi:ATP-dependent Clp protease ATP-binding subunit ClpC